MRIQEALHLANKLLKENGLSDWTVTIKNLKRTLGMCRYKSKTIVLGRFYLAAGSDEHIIDTILHEIAHALAGPGAGHGPKWKTACQKIGAIPKACCKDVTTPIGRYYAICPNCGIKYEYYRRPKYGLGDPKTGVTSYHCSVCGRGKGNLFFQDREKK